MRTLSEAEMDDIPMVQEWRNQKHTIWSFLDHFNKGSISSTIATAVVDKDLPNLFSQSTSEFIVKIVLESGATIRNGVDIDKSPEVRKLCFGEILEAFAKVSTVRNRSPYSQNFAQHLSFVGRRRTALPCKRWIHIGTTTGLE